MSASIASRPKAMTVNVRERSRDWFTPLNLHWAGVAILGLLNLYLLLHMAVAWQEAKSQDADAIARQQVDLKTAEIAVKPLQGLDTKLHTASVSADTFYQQRLPINYSEVASELGAIAKRDKVRLTRGSYSEAAVAGEAAGQLTEVRMDYSLSGDYNGLVHFLNGLERDKLFFLISGVTLTGQQTGLVNLRIHLETYLRGASSDEEAHRMSIGTEASATPVRSAPDAGGAR